MAGVSKLFVVGEPGGYMGSDGVNPIRLLIFVGDADRQWLEPQYVDKTITPIGRIRRLIPAGPDHPNALLDACIAFAPGYFTDCPTLPAMLVALKNAEVLDFHLGTDAIPPTWATLREEARPLFGDMGIWQAEFTPLRRG